jgi:hypothetical protein
MKSSLTKIENEKINEKEFVTILTENITNHFMHHGLTKKTKQRGSSQTQEFMSPFFALLLRNWLDPLKLDIGFEFKYNSSTDFQELSTLNTKIDKEWENMQKKYTVPGNSSTYEWHSDFSKLQLSLKDNEYIDGILKWKIFVLKANNCNMESISNLQTKILEGIVKENQLKETKISYITDRSKLWKDITEKNETTAKETEKTTQNGNDVSSIVSSGMSKFENQIFPGLIKTDFTLDFSSEFYKNKKMSEKQAYLFQSAKLLLWNLEREEISNDALMTIKWFGNLSLNIPTAGPFSRRKTTIKPVNHGVDEDKNPNDPPETVRRVETRQKNIGNMRRNRDIKKDEDQKQYTYNSGGFQIYFLTLHEEILANRILGFISRFTDFSIPELITEVAGYIEKIEDKHEFTSIEYNIYDFIIDQDHYGDFANFLNGEKFDDGYEFAYEEILFKILQNIIGRPIYILKILKNTENLLYLNVVYNSENTVFGEPIFLVDEYDDDDKKGNL